MEIQKLPSRPILMGHSMGGLLPQMLGAKGLTQALILLPPASPSGIMASRLLFDKAIAWGWGKRTLSGESGSSGRLRDLPAPFGGGNLQEAVNRPPQHFVHA